MGNYLFVWPIKEHVTLETALNENQKIITQIHSDVPVFHRRVLRKKLIYFQVWKNLSQDKFGKPQGVLSSSYW